MLTSYKAMPKRLRISETLRFSAPPNATKPTPAQSATYLCRPGHTSHANAATARRVVCVWFNFVWLSSAMLPPVLLLFSSSSGNPSPWNIRFAPRNLTYMPLNQVKSSHLVRLSFRNGEISSARSRFAESADPDKSLRGKRSAAEPRMAAPA